MRYLMFATSILFASAQLADAQSVFNPLPPSYAAPRTQMSPYLNLLRGGDPAANYYMGVLRDYDLRGVQARPPFTLEGIPRYDPTVDDRGELDVRDKQLPPTGHPAGFMIYNSYYRLPNQRGFIPYNPQGRPVQ